MFCGLYTQILNLTLSRNLDTAARCRRRCRHGQKRISYWQPCTRRFCLPVALTTACHKCGTIARCLAKHVSEGNGIRNREDRFTFSSGLDCLVPHHQGACLDFFLYFVLFLYIYMCIIAMASHRCNMYRSKMVHPTMAGFARGTAHDSRSKVVTVRAGG